MENYGKNYVFFCDTKFFGGNFFHFPSQEKGKETHGHNSKVKKTHEHKFQGQ